MAHMLSLMQFSFSKKRITTYLDIDTIMMAVKRYFIGLYQDMSINIKNLKKNNHAQNTY